jgi:thiol-disulfide isomerase/thioredoxin
MATVPGSNTDPEDDRPETDSPDAGAAAAPTPDDGASLGAATIAPPANPGIAAEVAGATPPRRSTHAGALVVAGVVVCALLALFWPRGETTGSRGGGLVDGKGRAAPLAARLAPVTLLHFWATWCPPCVGEIPTLTRLADDLHGEDNFRVVLVAVEDEPDKVSKFLGDELADGVLFDPNWVTANRYGTTQLPETYLLVDGKPVQRFVGAADWNDRELRQQLMAAIEKQRSGSGAGG